jgi:hypothetical protein
MTLGDAITWGLIVTASALIIKNQNKIMATQAELAQQLTDLKAQNDKAHAEHLAKLAELETAIANAGNTTPEVDAALAALKESIQRDDDMNPDAEPPTE